MSQNNLDVDKKNKGKGRWVPAEYEKDESFIDIDVGETLIGTFVASKENFRGNLYYIIQKDDGEIVKKNDTTNLHKWMANIEPGDRIKIVRKEDQKLPQKEGKPRKPLHIFHVDIWKVD